MKKIYLVIVVIFLLIAHSFSAQTNWSLHSYDDYPKLLVNVNGFQFFVTNTSGNTVGTAIDTTIIIGVKASGQIKFRYKTNMFALPFANVKSAIKTFDNCLVLVGEKYKDCDVMLTNKPCVLMKIDTNGIVQFTQTPTVTYTANAQLKTFTTVIQKPDSSYLVFSANYFHQYSKSGSLTSTQSHTLGSINSSALISNTTIIVSHSINSGTVTLNYLSVLDLMGNTVITNTTNNSYSKFLQNSLGDYYCLSINQTIEKINSSLTTISSSILSQGTYMINDFIILNDSVYACGIKNNKNSSILKFDGMFINYYYSSPNKYFNFKNISYYADSLYIISNDWANNLIGSNTVTNHSISYFKTNLNGDINLPIDAFIKDFSTNIGYAYTTQSTFSASPITNNFHYSLKVKLFNPGWDTIKSVYLNWLPINYQGIACDLIFNHQLFMGLSIPSGDSAYINTNFIDDALTSSSNQTLQAGTTFTLPNICVWTSSPNFKSDTYHFNDVYCGNVILPVTTGLKEINAETITVIAYPNPASDKLQFNHLKDGINYMVTCYNITGKEKQTQLISTQNNEMNMVSLDNGIYILKISDGTHTIHQKIIKQD